MRNKRSKSLVPVRKGSPLQTVQRTKIPWSGHERNQTFLSEAATKFVTVSGVSGLDDEQDSRCFAMLDFDRDGATDLFATNHGYPTFRLYRNQIDAAQACNFIAVRVVGGAKEAQPSKDWTNRDGVGATMLLTLPDGTLRYRQKQLGEGMAAQNSETILIGLGSQASIDTMEIRWPSGKTQMFTGLNAGELLTVYENPQDAPNSTGLVTEDYRPATPIEIPESLSANSTSECPLPYGDARLTLYVTTATWCEACLAKLPEVGRLRDSFLAQDLKIVGVPIDLEDTSDKLSSYQDQVKPPYELLVNASVEQRTWISDVVLHAFDEQVLPAAVLVDETGRILHVNLGLPSISTIRSKLDSPEPDHLAWRKFELLPPLEMTEEMLPLIFDGLMNVPDNKK